VVQEQVSSWEEAAFEDIEIDDLLHIGYVCNTKVQSDGFRESLYYDSEGSFNLWGSDSPKLASSVTVSGGLKIRDFQGEDTLVIPRSKLRGRSFHVCWVDLATSLCTHLGTCSSTPSFSDP
jgi:hypothetical protein